MKMQNPKTYFTLAQNILHLSCFYCFISLLLVSSLPVVVGPLPQPARRGPAPPWEVVRSQCRGLSAAVVWARGGNLLDPTSTPPQAAPPPAKGKTLNFQHFLSNSLYKKMARRPRALGLSYHLGL